ncbi:DNA cytosine methyltransferase [Enterococcus camelliae]|uniref:Cytosine-specific methyltransferase n=1 Tax=Enterococcus camelliae TaxID=453959 RepID=A0ABW5TJK9_9ENTE
MPYAIDLFCGAGGFSEGILQAGFDIIFSSDKSPMVEETYTNRHKQLGFIEGFDTHFELADIKELTSEMIFDSINSLKYGNKFKKGNIDVIFGGPPCQGFSRLGKRNASDPRNMLFHEYLRIIRDLRPKYVVMENVTGLLDMYMLDFPSVLSDNLYDGQNLVKDILNLELKDLGYTVLDVQVLNAANFGVPQQRNRVVFLAYRNDVHPIQYPTATNEDVSIFDAFGDLYEKNPWKYSTNYSSISKNGRTKSIKKKIPLSRTQLTNMEVSKHDDTIVERFSLYKQGENRKKAVTRLRQTGINLKKECPYLFYDSLFQLNSNQNTKIVYQIIRDLNLNNIQVNDKWIYYTNRQLALLFQYQSENIENNFNQTLCSLAKRLSASIFTTKVFWNKISPKLNQTITEEEYCESLLKGKITDDMVEAIFTKKGIRTRLNSESISPTMVTLPDDFIHPFFDRILTVREMARLQSFDDSFEFLGKRTTGGNKRAQETPQFTQVGNAVPPLLAKAIADEVYKACSKTNKKLSNENI